MSVSVPVLAQADLVVVGGAAGGVAAAAEAARGGRRVFLGAAQPYLGEDICAAGNFWLPEDVEPEAPLARALFLDDAGRRRAFVPPLHVKRRLDEELLAAGVRFLLGCLPADLLLDREGGLAGVLFSGKCGLFAVTARQVVDATPAALLARMAGLSFTPWPGGSLAFTRVLVGHRAEREDGVGVESLGPVSFPHRGTPVTREAFRYTIELPAPVFSPGVFAAAEMAARSRLWHREVVWSSERLGWIPPDGLLAEAPHVWRGVAGVAPEVFGTRLPGLHVLGPCAALDRAGARQMALAPVAIDAGRCLGRALAAVAGIVDVPCRPMREGAKDAGLREPAACFRPGMAAGGEVPAGDVALPTLGAFDVVVAGGGTGGAPAAIAAAREGARVLVLEAQHDLGGVGTLGCISVYYHGYRGGFNEEIARGLRELGGDDPGFRPDRWNFLHKAEWLRREIAAAGGEVWFGSHVSGVRQAGQRVCGLIVNTPWGRGLVRAEVVVDATGNADVAAAAGASCVMAGDHDLALQGSGLPSRPFLPECHNTDYTFIEDGDIVDTTRAFVAARRLFRDGFDVAPIPDTRERRQIVGDVTVTPLDIHVGRTWGDTICLSRSNFDSHGFTVHPLFIVLPPDRESVDAWLPLRALLPRGVTGVLVTGLGLSGHRDAMPVLRMQPDIQNHAYAAGLAAVPALARKGEVRRIDVRDLQRRLVRRGILPQVVLLHRDAPPLPRPILQSAARGPLDIHAEVAALMSVPEPSRLLLRQRLAEEGDAGRRAACARLLAAMGDASGASVLLAMLRAASGWDEGWNYTGMGQFGRSLSPLDECILALAQARVGEAKGVVLEKARALGEDPALSHVRAVAVYCETFPDAECAAVLAELLSRPGMAGHARVTPAEELADVPSGATDTAVRNRVLRELYLARALWRCGDRGNLAAGILGRYARDVRAHFARHARAVLAVPAGGRRPAAGTAAAGDGREAGIERRSP
jgi:ribulose 1,5-bisphosphate synthetase/thiazole synthase